MVGMLQPQLSMRRTRSISSARWKDRPSGTRFLPCHRPFAVAVPARLYAPAASMTTMPSSST